MHSSPLLFTFVLSLDFDLNLSRWTFKHISYYLENGNFQINPSPVHGNWSQWSEWSECSATCGEGSVVSKRSCTNPVPMYGGRECSGQASKHQPCHLRDCPTFAEKLLQGLYQQVSVPLSNKALRSVAMYGNKIYAGGEDMILYEIDSSDLGQTQRSIQGVFV